MSKNESKIGWKLKNVAVSLCLSSAAAILPAALAADVPADLNLPPMNLNVPTKDGTFYLNVMLNSVKNLNDYTFDSEIITYKKNSVVRATGKFYYKPLNLVRIEVTGQGYKSGSVLVRTSEGKVRAKGGNSLAWMKLTLAEDSRMLILPNGLNVVKSDYQHLVSGLKEAISQGGKCTISQSPVSVSYLNDKVTVLDVTDPQKADTIWQRLYIKPDNNLPIAWDIYNGGKLFSRAKFLNVKPNVGLTDDLFQL
ncbi:MAG TPA: hypothetical protein V6C72_17930, partial [Chroococcales cyanobacterium]